MAFGWGPVASEWGEAMGELPTDQFAIAVDPGRQSGLSAKHALSGARAWANSLGSQQFYLLLVVVVPILLLQFFFHYLDLQSARANEQTNNLVAARTVAAGLEAYLQDLLRQERAAGVALTLGGLDESSVVSLFRETSSDYPAVGGLTWLDPQGRVVVTGGSTARPTDLSDRWFVQQIRTGAESVVGDLEEGVGAGGPFFVVARGIRDEGGQLQGIIFTAVEPDRLADVIAGAPGHTSYSVLDRQGAIVYAFPSTPTVWDERLWLAKQNADVRTGLAPAYAGHEVSTVLPVLAGDDALVAAAPLRSLGWIAFYARPEDAVMAPLWRDVLVEVSLILLIGSVAVAAAYFLGRGATAPLRRLRRQAANLGLGEIPGPLPAEGPAEVRELAEAFNTMAAEVRLRERRWEESRQLLAAVLEQMPSGAVIVYASTRRLALANEQATRIFGSTVCERLFGSAVADDPICRADGAALPAGEAPLLRALDRGERVEGLELAYARADGSRGLVSVSAAPVCDPEGRVVAAVAICSDITERRRLEQAREEYVGAISHDLRNPLTAILGHAQLILLHPEREAKVQHSARAVEISAKRMKAMIQDLVDSARLESGQLDLELAPVDLAIALPDLAERLATGEQAGRLCVEVEAGLPAVGADVLQMERIVGNLVGNAFKFSPNGSKVTLSARREGEMAVVSVHDRGKGIGPADLPRIFDRYFSAGRQRERGEGLGLGLYIVKNLVEAHGGRIWVETQEGVGSAFNFTLPFAA